MFDNWEDLEKNIANCKKCELYKSRKNILLGGGNREAKIMFVGEGPGAEEDLQGKTFVGKAGQLMDMAYDIIGFDKSKAYYTNIIKCRPPFNREPNDEESKICLNYLRNQVILIKPQIIVLLGSVALKNILGQQYKLTEVRGKWFEKKGILYMPTWHPAALLRNESKKVEFIRDLKLVMEKYCERN